MIARATNGGTPKASCKLAGALTAASSTRRPVQQPELPGNHEETYGGASSRRISARCRTLVGALFLNGIDQHEIVLSDRRLTAASTSAV